jgi:uncharacterized membrane protein YeaQ/YmgE (transglycosylase-associated protein family)
MSILAWVVVGLIAGWLAQWVIRGFRFGLIGDLIVGVVGGLIGGYLATVLLHRPNPMSGINLPSILTALLGSILLLFVLRLVNRRI